MTKNAKIRIAIYLTILVAGLGYFASLHLSQLRPLTKEEKILKKTIKSDDQQQITVLKQGAFNPNAKDSDDFHRGSGDVQLVNFMDENRLVFMDNFTVTNGPDYKVYLLSHQDIQTEKQFKEIKEQSHQLDSVTQFKGFQVYTLPDDQDPEDIQSVLIWCEAFSQFITNADLN